MDLAKSFQIKVRIDEKEAITLSKFESVYKENSENDNEKNNRNMETRIAKMRDTVKNKEGIEFSREYYVYFQVPSTGNLPLIPELIKTYAQTMKENPPKEGEYNYLGSIYFDKSKNALIYSPKCDNKEIKKIIREISDKTFRRVKSGIDSEKPTFIERVAKKMNAIKNNPNDRKGIIITKEEYNKVKILKEGIDKITNKKDDAPAPESKDEEER